MLEIHKSIVVDENQKADESKFFDFSRSAMWAAKEHVFIDRR